MKVMASAPGKVTLFGEHAVVYGHPALVVAIEKRVKAIAESRNDDVIKISARDLRVPGIVISYIGNEVVLETDYGMVLPAIAYINKAIELTAKELGVKRGVNVEIKSEMPVGAGLGTSAAVAVSTIASYAAVNGYSLSREEIARLGWEVEKEVQGIASPMDTSITSLGGYLKIKYGSNSVERVPLKVEGELPLIIGYVEREAKTKDMVAMVRERMQKYPEIYEGIMKMIGHVVERAEASLLRGELKELGFLMNLNHSLLDALGVSTRRLNELVHVARDSGAYGAKLTGAGGGGCVIALVPEKGEIVETAMKLHGSMVLRTKLGADGVKVEEVDGKRLD
ncbi:MAG: mevalonate kinase [Fervidicoccaceae archaeon]|jgi:mevalonate kinase